LLAVLRLRLGGTFNRFPGKKGMAQGQGKGGRALPGEIATPVAISPVRWKCLTANSLSR
jgi:hypothetical protein